MTRLLGARPLASMLFACVLLVGCEGVPANAGYELSSDFRAPRERLLGLRVASRLASGHLLADEQTAKLGSLLSALLTGSGQSRIVVDLTSGTSTRSVDVLVELVVTEFHVASREDLDALRPSRLAGTMSLTRTLGARNSLGRARIWATGARLELSGKTAAPDTVRAFAAAMAELIK